MSLKFTRPLAAFTVVLGAAAATTTALAADVSTMQGASPVLVAGAVARDGLDQVGDAFSANRSERLRLWLTEEPAEQGLSAIAEGFHGRARWKASGQGLATRSRKDVLRFGIGYADAEAWTFRAIASSVEGDTRYADGAHDLDGWNVTVAGERRFGALRLGASTTKSWGRAEGKRLVAGAADATFSPKTSGHGVDLELGYMAQAGEVSIVPSTFLRYSRFGVEKFSERPGGKSALGFGKYAFEAVHAGVGLALAYNGSEAVKPRVAVSYERRISGGDGVLRGVQGSPGTPVSAKIITSRKNRLTVEPAISFTAGAVRLDVGARAGVDSRDNTAFVRAGLRF